MSRLLLTIFLLFAYVPAHSEAAPTQTNESPAIAEDSANSKPPPIVGALAQTLIRSGDMDSRQKIGIGALIFLVILFILFHQLKRELWKDVETKRDKN